LSHLLVTVARLLTDTSTSGCLISG
jgi:hypothetical protein